MKKIISLLLCLFVLSAVIPASAQYVEEPNYGIYFALSDKWNVKPNDHVWRYFYDGNADEFIKIEQVQLGDLVVRLDDEAVLNSVAKSVLADEKLKANYSLPGGAAVTISTSHEKGSYVKYNNVDYYKFEKVYAVSAEGFNSSTYYDYLYLTIKNNKLYAITYSRISTQNHSEDFTDFLNTLYFNLNDIKIIVNGKVIQPDSAPYIENNRTLVPIRAVAEALNYKVSWDPIDRVVTVKSADETKSLRMYIGSLQAIKNGKETITLDVAPSIKNDRTYLPIRAIGETLGAYIDWNANTRSVIIND